MQDLKQHYLYPSDLFVTNQPYRITTLLGTCVAVVLWDEVRRVGGINHYLLPYSKESTDDPLKYGNTSVKMLIEKVVALGGKKERLLAKIIGGAQKENNFYDTGLNNVKVATEMLTTEKIKIFSTNTGGTTGRKIIFYTNTGDLFMKFLQEEINN